MIGARHKRIENITWIDNRKGVGKNKIELRYGIINVNNTEKSIQVDALFKCNPPQYFLRLKNNIRNIAVEMYLPVNKLPMMISKLKKI